MKHTYEVFIDLDEVEDNAEDKVIDWHLDALKFFSKSFGSNCEDKLVTILKEYVQNIQENAINFEAVEKLHTVMERHIKQLFWLYEDIIYSPDTYLRYMEDLMTFYVNLTLRVLLHMKEKKKVSSRMVQNMSQKLIKQLRFYLLNSEKHIFHVLMYQICNYRNQIVRDVPIIMDSHICKRMLRDLYMHFLVISPIRGTSEESYYRLYILFENWKLIEDKKQHERIDECIKIVFNKGKKCVSENQNLKHILWTSVDSPNDTVRGPYMIKKYFEYIEDKLKHSDEDSSRIEGSNSESEKDLDAEYQELLNRICHEAKLVDSLPRCGIKACTQFFALQ